MRFFRLIFFVAMLVMVTTTATFTHARPIHGLHYPRSLLLDHHKVHRRFNQTSGLLQHNTLARVVIRRDAADDGGDLAAHDGYEAELHKLEAALKHYEEYGDAESLQVYLKGFTGGNGGGQNDAENAPAKDDQSEREEKPQPQQQPKPQQDSKPKQNPQEPKQPQQPQQPQHQQQPQQEGNDDCDDNADVSSNKKDDGQSSQPQPQKMIKKPKKQQPQQPSSDFGQPPSNPAQSAPAQQQPPPQHQPEQPKSPQKPAPAPPKSPSSSSSSSNSINGYTPPPFNAPPGSPSTASLYTSTTPFTGRATFYNTGLGACGIVNDDSQPIVAISSDLFEKYNPSSGNPNHNSLCGKKVEISWKGKTVQAFATDECPTCPKSSLDCSPSVFEGLDDKDKGVLEGITWRFV